VNIALIIIGGFYAFLAIGSASGKFFRNPQVIAGVKSVGVSDRYIPVLAVLEILGGLGLILGIWSRSLAIAAVTGLILYFFGAVCAHIRVRDSFKNSVPPAVLTLLGVVVLLLEAHR